MRAARELSSRNVWRQFFRNENFVEKNGCLNVTTANGGIKIKMVVVMSE